MASSNNQRKSFGMPHITRASLLFIAVLGFASSAMADVNESCERKYKEIAQAALKLAYWEFDQSESGWRQLEKCPVEQSLLIGRYIRKQESELRLVRWHFAQTLAVTGNTSRAIEEALLSLNPLEMEQHPTFSWNTYLQATVEFLKNDRAAFDVQFEMHRKASVAHPENQTNLKALTRLSNCFGQPYKIAYGCTAVKATKD